MKDISCEKDCCSVLHLFPDYSSSGLWCSKCGIGIGDPYTDFPKIPRTIFEKIEFWNYMWDVASSHEYASETMDFLEDEIISYGFKLASELNKYIECYFIPSNSKLDRNRRK